MKTRQTPPKFEGHPVTQTGLAFAGKIEGGPILDLLDVGYVVVEVTVADVQHPRRADGAVERLQKLAVTAAAVVDEDTPAAVLAWIHGQTEAEKTAADRRAGKEPLPITDEPARSWAALNGDE